MQSSHITPASSSPRTAHRLRGALALRAAIIVLTALLGGCSHGPHAVAQTPTETTVLELGVRSPSTPGAPGVRLQPELEVLEYSFEHAVDSIRPSVVSIISKREVTTSLPFFINRRHAEQVRREVRGLGSGVIIDQRGYILTNNHVVEGADFLLVRLDDGREFRADVVGADAKTDLAVVAIDAEGPFVAARLAIDEGLRVGQWVLAVGSPFGLSRSVTAGIVSATGRGSLGLTDYGDFVQTDAAINQGNSGGPLIDLEGRVVGINTAIVSPTGGSNGVGFAIPSQLAAIIKDQLIIYGIVRRGWLGLVPGMLTPDLAKSFHYRGEGGILVHDVDPAGPAHEAGIRSGDIITRFDRSIVTEVSDFRNRVAHASPDAPVKIRFWREGQGTFVQRVVPRLMPGTTPDAAPLPWPARTVNQGHGLELDDEVRSTSPIEESRSAPGVVIRSVEPGSLADEAGILPGEMLLRVDGSRVLSAADGLWRLERADFDEGVRVQLRGSRSTYFVILRRR